MFKTGGGPCLLLFAAVSLPSSLSAHCPPVSGMTEGSGGGGGKWYHLGNSKVTYGGAKTYCQGLGLSLASVATSEDTGNVFSHLRSNVVKAAWVDLTNPSLVSCYSPLACDLLLKDSSETTSISSLHFPSKVYVGGTGAALSCVLFQVGRPADESATYLKTVYCSGMYYPLCYSDCGAQTSASCTPPASVTTELVGNKYYHGATTQIPFTGASDYCTGLAGGHFVLASVATQEDFSNVVAFNQNGGTFAQNAWVDLHNPSGESACTSDVTCSGKFKDLSSGAPVDTTSWTDMDFAEVSKASPSKLCLRLKRSSVLGVVGVDCDASLEYPICQYECGVAGGWSEWSTTIGCTVTCGPGSKLETRTCNNPAPSGAGAPCFGDSRKISNCHDNDPCPLCPPAPQSSSVQFDSYIIMKSPVLPWSDAVTWCQDQGLSLMLATEPGIAAVAQTATTDVWLNARHQSSSADCDDSGGACTTSTALQAETAAGSDAIFNLVPKVVADESFLGQGSCFYYTTTDGGTIQDTDCTLAKEGACGGMCNVVTCPADFPYAFDNGAKCCSADDPCTGSILNFYETCCNSPETTCSNAVGPCGSAVVDGGWSDWVNGSCTETCGPGFLEQNRTCDSPSVANGGANCIGDSFQTVLPCDDGPCPIHGNWTEWASSTPCSVTCGPGELNETRSCTNPAPEHGGDNCTGDTHQTVACDDGPCPINGNWTEWTSATPCSVTCGPGELNETRSCTNPAPKHGGDNCTGDAHQTVACDEGPCPIHGNWTEWTSSTPCSVTCGPGELNETRSCTNPAPEHGGNNCVGDTLQTVPCNDGPCPINGNWTEWAPSTPCSVTCGPGQLNETRSCTNPAPEHGGDNCTGDAHQTAACDDGPCPVHGGFCAWTDDPAGCPVTCGGLGLALLEQTRACDCPTPEHGGSNCTGDWAQDVDCGTTTCPPTWSEWGPWSPCSKTCDYGVERRTRTCDPPGTCTGLGLDTETRYCNLTECAPDTLGVRMAPYFMTAAAKAEFLASPAFDTVPADGGVRPKVHCVHSCMLKRAHRHDYESCNGYIFEGGECKLGYMDPDWVYEQSTNPGTDTIIYFDF